MLLAAALLLVRFSPLPRLQETSIEVQLLTDVVEQLPEPEPGAVVESTEPVDVVQAEKLPAVIEPAEPQRTDWYAITESAAQEAVTATNRVDSMHPAFAEKRRLAAINFPASQASVKKPIWENVVTDNIGRKILVSGDCYRVLEDPRATYYEIHRELGQFLTYCSPDNEAPIGVAWVDDIRDNYAYLNFQE